MRLRALLSLLVQGGVKLALISPLLWHLRAHHTVCHADTSLVAEHLCCTRDILDQNQCCSSIASMQWSPVFRCVLSSS